MSLSIVLAGWVAVSVLLSPLIGRFLSVQNDNESHRDAQQIQPRSSSSNRTRTSAKPSMRRNVAMQLSRREAGWRVG